VAFFGAHAVSHYSATPLHAAILLGILNFRFIDFFEFGGVLKRLVYDFASASGQFRFDVFYYEFAVVLSAAHWSC